MIISLKYNPQNLTVRIKSTQPSECWDEIKYILTAQPGVTAGENIIDIKWDIFSNRLEEINKICETHSVELKPTDDATKRLFDAAIKNLKVNLYVIENKYGIEKGHLETVHSYTNDQNLLDNMHKKPRRGRSAAINMVITSTGAGKAVTKVIPSLEGKLSANAVRVPTPNVSLAILKLSLNSDTSVEDINNVMRDAALKGNLINQINYQLNPDLVSTDIIGNTCCSVYDSNATIASGKDVVLYTWYDNEFGYTKQVIRLAKLIAKVRRLTYY